MIEGSSDSNNSARDVDRCFLLQNIELRKLKNPVTGKGLQQQRI